jgi:hypothetical protein
MKSIGALRFGLVAAALLILAGCGKDELVAPGGAEQDVKVTRGSMDGSQSEKPPTNGPGPIVGDDGGAGISDDGDDVGDGERNRKKKPAH